MSDFSNPYQSPAAETVKMPSVHGSLTDMMVKYLRDVSPWLRFMGIMGFIGSGVLAISGIVSLAAMSFSVSETGDFFNYGRNSVFSSFFIGNIGAMLAMYAIYFIGAGVVVFLPSLFTYRFGTGIRSFLQNKSEKDLEFAFKNNKSFWLFRGIFTIITLAIVPVFIIVAIVTAVAAMALF